MINQLIKLACSYFRFDSEQITYIHWIEIYLLDKVIHSSHNWALMGLLIVNCTFAVKPDTSSNPLSPPNHTTAGQTGPICVCTFTTEPVTSSNLLSPPNHTTAGRVGPLIVCTFTTEPVTSSNPLSPPNHTMAGQVGPLIVCTFTTEPVTSSNPLSPPNHTTAGQVGPTIVCTLTEQPVTVYSEYSVRKDDLIIGDLYLLRQDTGMERKRCV